MHVQLTILMLLLGISSASAADEKSMNELFKKYEQIMDQKKVELIDEVFSQRFLRETGGKKEFVEKINELPVTATKQEAVVSWKKGLKGEIYFARLRESALEKTKTPDNGGSEFIVIKEDGKLKIDGTISDGD